MSAKRIAHPSAVKRIEPSFPRVARSAVGGLRSLLGDDSNTPAGEIASGRVGSGLEAPLPERQPPPTHLDRCFLFVDVSGFSAYVDSHGDHAAIEVLDQFRHLVRAVAARRGVRVAKWLGDGVMLVGTSPSVTSAAGAELLCHYESSGVDIHAGLASGPVLLFEGDDYIGRPVNLAARLCDAAGKSEFLAAIDHTALPDWVESAGTVTVRASGMGDVDDVHQLVVARRVLDRFGTAA